MPTLQARVRGGALFFLAGAVGCASLGARGPNDEAASLAAATVSCRPGSEAPGTRELDALGHAIRAEICVMMDAGARAWNRGDLDTFVEDYLPDATYVGSRGLVRGPVAIKAAYAPRFAPGVMRDSLSFERLEVDVLAPDVAHVLAVYVLSRGDSVTARGPTSLIMRRVGSRWRIAHDHSS